MHEVCEQHESKANGQPRKIAVRYGHMGILGEFEYSAGGCLCPGTKVLVETDRGLELGQVVCYTMLSGSGVGVDPKQIERYLETSGQEYLQHNAGKVLRVATAQDLREEEHIRADARAKKQYCQEAATALGLKMKIVCVEHLFGGERIIFYFAAEGRVDFRQMVRDLAREYQTRIELRQIGARDEARLLADYEICGRECCCRSVLKILRPVNMKMAKLQKATLDPSKVSGRCGRLRCCLSFEHRSYEELASQLPKVGASVETSQGRGRVRDRQILTQLVQVVLDDNRLVAVPVEELSPAARPQERRHSAEDPAEGEVTEPEMEKSDSMDETSNVGLPPGSSEEERPADENASQRKRRRRTRRKKKQ